MRTRKDKFDRGDIRVTVVVVDGADGAGAANRGGVVVPVAAPGAPGGVDDPGTRLAGPGTPGESVAVVRLPSAPVDVATMLGGSVLFAANVVLVVGTFADGGIPDGIGVTPPPGAMGAVDGAAVGVTDDCFVSVKGDRFDSPPSKEGVLSKLMEESLDLTGVEPAVKVCKAKLRCTCSRVSRGEGRERVLVRSREGGRISRNVKEFGKTTATNENGARRLHPHSPLPEAFCTPTRQSPKRVEHNLAGETGTPCTGQK